MTLSKLRKVDFAAVTCAEAELIDYFRRHASTLSSLHLSSVWIDECTEGWKGVFDAMKTCLTLKHVDRLNISGCLIQRMVGEGGNECLIVDMGLVDLGSQQPGGAGKLVAD